ncbi:hypothetical protein GWK08_15980 [Leptobacterium flavescens]|uniref:Uncharacterized protein n=1 Tax=Leptobacterium flavescens TaxID=472055 RepID=A0A6P0UWY2_9FLAO|nr:hypothetical protein [Leptobacterium flavescens]NER14956.1 hypothetical protein [Leptobacterium flavescens]
MSSITFLVSSCKIDKSNREVFWEGRRIQTRGHLICSGEDHRFIVYFVEPGNELPNPTYLKSYKLGAIFVPVNEMDAYLGLANEEEPVYAYLNAARPELNSITVNEPLREEIYQGY